MKDKVFEISTGIRKVPTFEKQGFYKFLHHNYSKTCVLAIGFYSF